ncbi:MAG TPA: CHAT domain-containing protein [Actinophytocola sp.]|uniref:CHAT domain-containing protein n=1 Tax=Actinophytocola sp. TaxID=1872138 RepID=UPI002DF8D068|nr:CHAT domain-containing protein [Actinophytocola sp.]
MPASPSLDGSPADRAAAALDLVGRDPRKALSEADAAVAGAQGDVAAASLAHRAAGLALRELGDLAMAESRARIGVRVAARRGAIQAAAEARMSLAFILLDRGRIRAALTEADRAAAGLTGLPAVRLACQRALILQRAGRLDEALTGYASALPTLRRTGDLLWQARVHNNRGLLHTHRGALVAADADFVKASALWRELGRDVHAAESECNRGNVAALSGDAPSALASYDRAETAPALQNKPNPQLHLNRCQVLLSVGLFDDARRTAERAVAELKAVGQHADLAEAQLWLAQAAAALGWSDVAGREARAAYAAFTRQDRPGWAALARLAALRAAESTATVRSALECARDLAAAGWRVAELEATLIAARVALRTGDLATAERVLESAGPARRSGTLGVRVRGWHAQALLRQAHGDRRGALSALRAGLALVEQRQAVLGATELRVHVATFGTELANFGLDLAIAAGTPRDILAWAERARARAMRLRPVKPPDDVELADALAELRRITAEGTQARLAGGSRPRTALRRAAEERVVRASRVARNPLHQPGGAPPSAADLADALGATVLVELIRQDGELLAVTVRNSRCRLHRIGQLGPVAGALETATSALRTLALDFGTPRGRTAVRQAAESAGKVLDTLLLDPLRAEISGRPLVIVPTAGLHAMPWSLLPSLAGVPVRVAPSAAAWLRAVRTPQSTEDGGTILAAGPGLRAAQHEVAALARQDPSAKAFLGPDVTVPAVLTALDGAELAHIAAHGLLRTDNPLLSALELVDGPLTVYDLERLGRAPATVILPACQSGVSAVRAGDEILGLVSALLTLGTRTVVATVTPVSDVDTAPIMLALHEELRNGTAPAEAMAAARAVGGRGGDGSVAAAASFVCFGA